MLDDDPFFWTAKAESILRETRLERNSEPKHNDITTVVLFASARVAL